MKHALSALVPLSLKTAVYDRLNRAKLNRLLRTKRRFRKRQQNGTRVGSKAPAGVNLVAYIRAEVGLGTAARGIAAALDVAGIPFNIINLEHGNFSSHTNYSWSHKEALRSDYDITIVCVNPSDSFLLRTKVSPELLGNRYVIGNWYWELPEIPDGWTSEFEFTDEVWAPSHFIHSAVSAKSPVPVVRVPTAVQLTAGQKLPRSDFNLPEARFLFLGMFDTKSVLQRKNPLGVVSAFKSAFAKNDSNVGLVLKFSDPDYEQPLLRQLKEELIGLDNVFLIDRMLSALELTSLIDSCDCFVSLHRSEGFGLGPAEAMTLGKPTIITNWSGNTDYMTEDNCIPIDYELVKLGRDYGPYKGHQQWAEPNLDQASYWMGRIAREPELARTIGARGRETIKNEFSTEAVAKLIADRLQQIRKMF